MAKLTAPLMSLDARGKLGNSMVFLGWKGIKTVRQWVIPANPRSPGQVAQRDRLTALVATWHGLGAPDITAWGHAAPLSPKPGSGFNAFTAAAMAAYVADANAHMANTVTATPGSTKLDIASILIKCSDQSAVASDANLVAKYGTSARNLSTEAAMVWVGGSSDYEASITGLTPGTVYYVRLWDTNNATWVSGLFSGTPTV